MKKFIAILITAITIVLTLSVSAGADTIRGDVNRDQNFDAFDLLALKRIVLGTYEGDYNIEFAADIDNNGIVDAMDYLIMKRVYLGTAEFPELPKKPDRVPGEIVITFKQDTPRETMRTVLEDLCMEAYGTQDRASVAQYIKLPPDYSTICIITVPDEKIHEYVEKAKANENVTCAELNAIWYPA